MLKLWSGIVIVMLALVGCNTATYPTRTPVRSPNVTVEPTLLPPPTRTSVLAIATPANSRCPSAPPARLIVLERGRVIEKDQRLNLRSGPGTDYTSLLLIREGALFFVLDGPACAEGFTWFRVRYKGAIGWIAEGDLQEYYVEPYLVS